MKSKIYQFDPVIYPFPLLVMRDIDGDELAKTFWVVNEREECIEAQDDFKPDGCVTARILCLSDKNTNKLYYAVLIFRPRAIRYGIVTHESIHVANAYLQYLGVTPARAYADEEYAYFGGWVSNCIWSVLNKEPQLMKGTVYGEQ